MHGQVDLTSLRIRGRLLQVDKLKFQVERSFSATFTGCVDGELQVRTLPQTQPKYTDAWIYQICHWLSEKWMFFTCHSRIYQTDHICIICVYVYIRPRPAEILLSTIRFIADADALCGQWWAYPNDATANESGKPHQSLWDRVYSEAAETCGAGCQQNNILW